MTVQQQLEPTNLTNQAAQVIDHAVKTTHNAANLAVAGARDASQQLSEAARAASEAAVTYIRKEPLTAMLVSAAVGALLMGLVAAVRFSGRRD